MKGGLRRVTGAMLLAVSFAAGAAPLPQADTAAESPALRSALAGLLDDYLKVLPASVSRHGVQARSDALSAACRADEAGCARVLPRQFDLLTDAWTARRPDVPPSVHDGVLVSLMVDLCAIAWNTEMGGRCLPGQLRSMATLAASIWNALGYQHLFLAYLESGERAAALARQAPNTIGMARNALAAELQGRNGDAFMQWALLLGPLQLADNEHATQLTAMSNMARLAARQGRLERAVQWQQAGLTVLEGRPALRTEAGCTLLGQQFDIDLAQDMASARPFPGEQRIGQLIAQDCSFSARALEFALSELMQGRAPAALSVLDASAAACQRPPQCGYQRRQQIGQLRAVAGGEAAVLRTLAAWWVARLATGDTILATEIDIAWALAERLRLGGAPADALALLQQLDRHIGHLRGAYYPPADLARYDDLTRMRVRLEVVSGGVAALKDTESLRAQKLLRQLEVARWTRQLAKVSDAAALAELNQRLQLGASMRQALAQLPPGQHGVLRTTFEYMLDDINESEIDFREAYLARLAGKQRGDREGSIRMPLRHFEAWSFASGADGGVLDEDDAYLSWLRVPGGYVGTLLARPSGRTGLAMADHPAEQSQRFIAFSEQDEALLQLYRHMLQDGAGALRAAKSSGPSYRDANGLLLARQPLWQLADGSLAAAQQAPPGARRVTDARPIADLLYQRLLAPFAPLYQEALRLIVSPDGALVYLPFETLSRDGVSVLEAIDIGYIQSLGVYGELKKRSASRKRGAPTLLSVADPVYPGAAPSDAANPMAAIAWRPLPGTRTEALAIGALFRQPRQLLGQSASKRALAGLVQNQELRQFQTLHFATHGYVDDERSALVLSPGDGPLGAYLSDQEIVQWQLESELVLLSACNTGIGRRQQGEGVVGLPYAFFMAGNLNTLMSLWPVDDAGTAALIPAFMQRVQRGEDHVTALNNTKRAFARGQFGAALSNPRIWSAFVLYGVPLAASADQKPSSRQTSAMAERK